MNKLLERVQVVLKPLEEIATITIGEFVHKNNQDNSAVYPVFNGGTSPTGYYDKFNNFGDRIIVSARGANAGFINRISKPYWAGNSCYSVGIIDCDKYNWLYVYHWLKKNENTLIESQQGGGIPSVSKKQMEVFQIPIPCPDNPQKSLAIQKEIVRILDTFTELTAELTARKKQYEYYRDQLLSFEDKDVEWKTLEDVAGYSNDRISFDKLDKNNYVGVDNLLQNREGKTISTYVPQSGNSTKYYVNDILIGNIRPYLKKIWHADRIGGTNGDVLVIHPTDKEITSRFLYHILADDKFFAYNMQNAKGAKMPRGNKSQIMKYIIPKPSLEEQERIVAILDKFDTLTTSISEGLPKEIEQRKKQYEYYRDMLLAFPKDN